MDRFSSYCNKGTRDLGGVLQVLQIKILEEVIIKLVQQDLKEEFDLLTNEKYIYIYERLKKLNLITNKNGILRVGG